MVQKKLIKNMWIKERWKRAGEYRDYYNKEHNTNLSKKEFFKNDNPLINSISKIKLSYEIKKNTINDSKQSKENYSFFAPQETYTIYAVKNPETLNSIETKVSDSIKSLFKGEQINYIEKKLEIRTQEINFRGSEEEKLKYNEIDINLIRNKDYYIKNNERLKLNLKKKVSGKTKFNQDYDLHIWG